MGNQHVINALNFDSIFSQLELRSFAAINQDMAIIEAPVVPTTTIAKPAPAVKTISVDEYADQMALSLAQLETVTLMLAVLDQTDGGPAPTE
jgi:hypothetical protein